MLHSLAALLRITIRDSQAYLMEVMDSQQLMLLQWVPLIDAMIQTI